MTKKEKAELIRYMGGWYDCMQEMVSSGNIKHDPKDDKIFSTIEKLINEA